MKNKLKIFTIIILSIFLVGCYKNMNPSERVEDLMDRYIKNDTNIIEELDEYVDNQDITEEQKRRYKEIIKNEYQTIKYSVKDEKIDGDEAKVEVEIEVKDLYKASKDASLYMREHRDEFLIDKIYNEEKFIDHKLKTMEESNDRVEYTIFINLKRVDGIWTIEEIDEDTLEKIHGIYDYESDNQET